jgi:hypothetical protein
LGADAGRGRARADDVVGRQMCRAKRHGDGEFAAAAGLAFDVDRAFVKLDQLLHESEANSASLKGPALGTLDAVKALEQARQFRRRNAGSRVDHGEFRHRAIG